MQPTGLKYRIEGDKLIFNASATESKTIQQSGFNMKQDISVAAEVIYQKQ